MSYYIDNSYVSLNKHNEELCGDRVETTYYDGTQTLVLADGMGSGVRANILSSLTSKIICTMMSSGMSVEDCVETIAATLPMRKDVMVAYSTFTILQITSEGDAYMVQFDNPLSILLRDGKAVEYPVEVNVIGDKTLYETRMKVELGDTFVMFSDGVSHAGIGISMSFGWQNEHICSFLESKCSVNDSPHTIATKLVEAAKELYLGVMGDDTTVAVMKVRQRSELSIMLGPPANPEDDVRVIEDFLSRPGKKIVSGGTTSKIVSRYLGEKVETCLDYLDPKIPPAGKMKGVDLVTEGVITLGRVMELSEQMIDGTIPVDWKNNKDAATTVTKMMFEDATDINIFVGRAMNPAHQNPQLPINFSIKMKIVEVLSHNLEKCGKRVNVQYF
ncbi:MAG TPA: SpoIIE family protein phosphatase [Candidatus Faecivivens stercoripullorum]|uniref:SpoIIE family protein phosphatase n=1 Tax=Candidatus Faecivivens stercoripullorum TaxID=2840805 RepID=A0A9D1KSS8_9FIRM|nr:SpoIIE family protein phosphatase [Candidatus Faecivivens stercoripullorum]